MKESDNIGWPPPSVPSQAINSLPFPFHALWKSLLTLHHTLALSLTHMKGDSCLITQPYTHMHKLPPPITHAPSPPPTHTDTQNLHPCTRFLGSEPTSTCIHSFANESISWSHSFHFCQRQSISLLHPVLTEQQGSSEIERKGKGLQHPGSSKTPPFFFYLIWISRDTVFWWCVTVLCAWCVQRGEGIKKYQASNTSSQVYALYLTFPLPFAELTY